MNDYIYYTKAEASALIPKFQHLVGTTFIGGATKRTFCVKFLFLIPADPIKYKELGDLLGGYSLELISWDDVIGYTHLYTKDEYALAIYATTLEGDFPALFHLLPIHLVVDNTGALVDGFGI